MRRLIYGLFLIMVLSQFPQVSETFKEEQEGVNAAYKKVETTYKTAVKTYDKAQSDFENIQASVNRLKADIDKSVASAQAIKAGAAKSYGELGTQADKVREVLSVAKAKGEAAVSTRSKAQ